MTELPKQFPAPAGQSKHLKGAIKTLIYGPLKELYDIPGAGLTESLLSDVDFLTGQQI